MTIKSITSQPVAVYEKPAYDQPGHPFRVKNLDSAATVYYDSTPTVTADQSSRLLPGSSVIFGGGADIWMSTAQQGLSVLVDYAGSSTGSDESGNVAAILTNGSATSAPGVPNIVSAEAILENPAGSPYTLLTLPAAGRVWGVSLSAALAAGSTYSGGVMQAYARIGTSGGLSLEVVELAIGGPSQNDSGHGDLAFNGLQLAAGTGIFLDVDNGASLPVGTGLRASAVVLYSVP